MRLPRRSLRGDGGLQVPAKPPTTRQPSMALISELSCRYRGATPCSPVPMCSVPSVAQVYTVRVVPCRRGGCAVTLHLRPLGQSDLQITPVGIGTAPIGSTATWRISWGPQDEQAAIRAIHAALDSGVNWIDTAPFYGWGRA